MLYATKIALVGVYVELTPLCVVYFVMLAYLATYRINSTTRYNLIQHHIPCVPWPVVLQFCWGLGIMTKPTYAHICGVMSKSRTFYLVFHRHFGHKVAIYFASKPNAHYTGRERDRRTSNRAHRGDQPHAEITSCHKNAFLISLANCECWLYQQSVNIAMESTYCRPKPQQLCVSRQHQ